MSINYHQWLYSPSVAPWPLFRFPYHIKAKGVFRLHNVNIVGFYYFFNCYMFRSYDHLQVDIYCYNINVAYMENTQATGCKHQRLRFLILYTVSRTGIRSPQGLFLHTEALRRAYPCSRSPTDCV
jgi:hypothetical protein